MKFVNSQINKLIKYPELSYLDKKDKRFEASIYDVRLFNTDITVALGNHNEDFKEHNIIYFPIYLILNSKVKSRIGVYELEEQLLNQVNDEDGDIDLGSPHFYGPILFSFAKTMIQSTEKKAPIKSSPVLPDMDQQIDDILEQNLSQRSSQRYSRKSSSRSSQRSSRKSSSTSSERSSRKSSPSSKQSSTWIEEYMNNLEQPDYMNYKIKETVPDGNCFFQAVSFALNSVNNPKSIKDIRELLSIEVDQNIYNIYKENYNNFKAKLDNFNTQIETLKTEALKNKSELTKTKDRKQQTELINIGKAIKKKQEQITIKNQAEIELIEDYKFMKNIKNLEELKEFIKKSAYWADPWSISVLERLLNVKFVLLSRKAFEEGDFDNVMNCGFMDNELERRKVERDIDFAPDHYIILDYNGNHYVLITYNDLQAFKFEEMPDIIKELIKNKCLERNAGPYYLISEFRKYKYPELEIEEINPSLFNEKTVFQIYSHSAPKAPGAGVGETMDPVDNDFDELSVIKHWRRELTKLIDLDYETIKKNPDSVHLLKSTRNAKLTKFIRGVPPEDPSRRLDDLMNIRRILLRSN